jgi:hypothetical protein
MEFDVKRLKKQDSVDPPSGQIIRRKSIDLSDDFNQVNFRNEQAGCGVMICKIFNFGGKKH